MAGSGLLFLGALSCYSLIAVVAYFGLSLVLLGLGSKLYVHLMGLLKKPCKDPLAKVESLHLEVTEEQVQGILSQVTNHINVAAATTKRQGNPARRAKSMASKKRCWTPALSVPTPTRSASNA